MLVLPMTTACVGLAPPRRKLPTFTGEGTDGCATWYTPPVTLTFCEASVSWQLGWQLPTLFASETKAMVAVPLIAPAAPVFIPTVRLLALVAPGASRLKLPAAVTGAFPLMLAL